MRNIIIILTIAGVAAAAIFYTLSLNEKPTVINSPMPTNQPSATIVTQDTVSTTPPAITSITNTIKMGGSSYRDPNGLYTFLYPADYKIDTENENTLTRIYKVGATQRGPDGDVRWRYYGV